MWVKEYHASAEDKQEWITKKKTLQERLKKVSHHLYFSIGFLYQHSHPFQHAEACGLWHREYEDLLVAERNSAIEARKTL